MVDEAHERSLCSDILLGVLKKIKKRRSDLRIIISSATIQAEEFLRFFNGSAAMSGSEGDDALGKTGRIFQLPGRMYPVDIHYLEAPAENYVEKALSTVFDIHAQEDDGDILIFLTGAEEISHAVQQLTSRAYRSLGSSSKRLQALPLYSGLTTEQQMSVFEEAPPNTRKVIAATNIAEASVTIPNVVYVIDCGFVKLRAYNPSTGMETLTATPVSKASAAQRAGRAGRIKPGKCYRLYTEADFAKLDGQSSPEIQRSNLAPVILQLKALGIDNVVRFDFLTPPPAELMVRATELLYSLGAIDDYAKLTRPLGVHMAELAGLEPMMAKTLLSAPDFGCLSEMLSIAAMTSSQGSVWFAHEGEKKRSETARRKFAAEEGDHLTLLNAYQAFVTKGRKEGKWCHDNYLNHKSMARAVSVRNQLRRYLERFGIAVEESLAPNKSSELDGVSIGEKIRRCLTTGFFSQAAKFQPDGTFKTVNGGTTLHAHPSSLFFVSRHRMHTKDRDQHIADGSLEPQGRMDHLPRGDGDFVEDIHSRYLEN